MPIGVGAERLSFLPPGSFVVDPGAWRSQTEKNVGTPISFDDPGPSGFKVVSLPKTGIVGLLRVIFDGTAVVVTAAATAGHDWPYGLIRSLKLSVNGQNDLFSVDGTFLHALRFARFPAYEDVVDVFPDAVGGGGALAVQTHDLYLTFEVPVAIDPITLAGALFAQSDSVNIALRVDQAANADLFSANPANVTIDGTFKGQLTWFEIPIDDEERLVLPDLSRLHGCFANDTSFTNTGEVRTPLIRTEGQLERLFIQVERNTNNRLSADPIKAAADLINQVRLEYGGNNKPMIYDPAADLLAVNNQHYGGVLPYDYLCLDLVKEDPIRDALFFQGVTELATVVTVNTGVTVANGRVRLVQETLF